MRRYFFYKHDRGLKFKDIPDYGDLMTMEEFVDCVKMGGFIDYDGYGKYALEDMVSNKVITPSEVKYQRNLLHGFTHVVWYNR